MYSLDSQQGNVASASAVDMTSAADGLVLTPGSPIEIIEWGYVLATLTGAPTSGFVAALDKRITPSSDTGRVDDITTLTLTAAQVATLGTAAGKVAVIRSRPTGPTTGESALVILPGQQIVFEIATALSGGGVAATGFQFVIFKNLARGDQAVTKELIVTS
jgi:hypothetical protein